MNRTGSLAALAALAPLAALAALAALTLPAVSVPVRAQNSRENSRPRPFTEMSAAAQRLQTTACRRQSPTGCR